MTVEQVLVLIVIAVPIGLVVANRLRVDLAALLIAVALGAAQYAGLGILGPAHTPEDAAKAISGLGRPEIVILLSLFILMRGLERTKFTRWIAQRLIAVGGQSERSLIVLFTATAAFLSLFMNNLAVGVLLLPSAMNIARRTRINPSKLLMPVAYGSLLGGSATYFTTANIIVSGLLTTSEPPQAPLRILDFTPTGGLIALAGIAFMALLGPRLLPNRAPLNEEIIPRYTPTELEKMYSLNERLWEAEVRPGSPLIGQTIAQANIGEWLGVAILAIWRKRQSIAPPPPGEKIIQGDLLLLVGREERVSQLEQKGLAVGRTPNGHISTRDVALVEVIPAPHSAIAGHTLKELEFRKTYGFTAVALWREGRSYRTDVGDFTLRLGDSFLMVGPQNRLKQLQASPDFIVLEPDLSSQPVEARKVALAVGLTAGAVAASIAGAPVYLAMLTAALLAVLARILSMEEAYRSVQWPAIFLIAGMYSVSLAMTETGLAAQLGDHIIEIARPFGTLGLAAACYLLTALLTQIMGGQVTALVTGPIAISAALQLHTSPHAIAVATAIGCSASFLTPLAHPVNMIMIGPANYHFGDFFRVGWILTIVSFVALLAGMVLFWGLRL